MAHVNVFYELEQGVTTKIRGSAASFFMPDPVVVLNQTWSVSGCGIRCRTQIDGQMGFSSLCRIS